VVGALKVLTSVGAKILLDLNSGKIATPLILSISLLLMPISIVLEVSEKELRKIVNTD